MSEYFGKWYFWVIVVIIIVIILWVVTKWKTSENHNKSSTTQKCTLSDTSEYIKPRKKRIIRQPSRNVGSLYDSVPDLDQVDEIDESIDLTPALPEFLFEQEELPKKQSIGEKECQRIIEEIYGVPFQTQVRPDWLRNPITGYKMELDLYNESLQLAVEYNGIQHYKYTPYFHKSFQKFKDQVGRDHAKIDICDEKGIYVITVPYCVPNDKIEKFIRYNLPDAVRAREALKDAN
ncbi:Hypothetical protein POVR1_LOCUS527 [uncultured virus]|nr:Hypothetical protein POVR1_LOCUS527 [uncultured virus]